MVWLRRRLTSAQRLQQSKGTVKSQSGTVSLGSRLPCYTLIPLHGFCTFENSTVLVLYHIYSVYTVCNIILETSICKNETRENCEIFHPQKFSPRIVCAHMVYNESFSSTYCICCSTFLVNTRNSSPVQSSFSGFILHYKIQF